MMLFSMVCNAKESSISTKNIIPMKISLTFTVHIDNN